MRQQYTEIKFRKDSIKLIQIMNHILADYKSQGYTVTVRQLYYQLVSKDVIANTEKSYKKITNLVNDARMAGYMDWDMIEDRTRSFERRGHWGSEQSIVRACGKQYHIDMWDNQDTRVFTLVEKEALAGVLSKPCFLWDVPLLAARGYPSVTVVREFCEADILPAIRNGQHVKILHLGDHDPSGIDMTRDLKNRISIFCGDDEWMVEVDRIALNMEQVEEQKPPPNPAKQSDSRFADYEKIYGDKSWELDALSPSYIDRLVTSHIESYIDEDKWSEKEEERQAGRDRIIKVADAMLAEALKAGK